MEGKDGAAERKRAGRTRREFLWFPVALDLCNQHAKLLMSKSTTRTQTVYTLYSTHVHAHTYTQETHACGHTLSKLLTHELCGDVCSCGVWRRSTSQINARRWSVKNITSMQCYTELLCNMVYNSLESDFFFYFLKWS